MKSIIAGHFSKYSPMMTLIALSASCATKDNYAHGNLLSLTYGYSFLVEDRCGYTALGERYREAIIAKMDSCHFSDDVQLEFYQSAAMDSTRELSKMYGYSFTKPSLELTEKVSDFCKRPAEQSDIDYIQKRFSDYDDGKIKLSEVVDQFFGKPRNCEELAKRIFVPAGQ